MIGIYFSGTGNTKYCVETFLRAYDGGSAAFSIEDGGRCTMCYRCVNHCPTKAITLLGKRVVAQCRIEHYR